MLAGTILTSLVFKFFVFIFVLGILVTVHELGHFLLAKFFRVGVIEFALGFGPKLFSRKYGDTIYSVRSIPLGGFVRMVGDDPRAINEAAEGSLQPTSNDQEVDPVLMSDQSRWFLKKKFWPKFLIVFAGPLFNLILALLLSFSLHLIYGVHEPTDEPVIGDVVPGYPAQQAGLIKGDRVISIGEFKPKSWTELANEINNKASNGVKLLVEREGKTLPFEIKGRLSDEEEAAVTGQERRFQIGIISSFKTRSVNSVFEAISIAGSETYFITKMTLGGILKMFSGFISPKSIRGPIFIFNKAGEFAEQGLYQLLRFMMYLSISLAVLNLLPIPVLDGGHLFIFIIEAIAGRPLSLAAQERASQVGMVLLLSLMLFAVGNDISSLISG